MHEDETVAKHIGDIASFSNTSVSVTQDWCVGYARMAELEEISKFVLFAPKLGPIMLWS